MGGVGLFGGGGYGYGGAYAGQAQELARLEHVSPHSTHYFTTPPCPNTHPIFLSLSFLLTHSFVSTHHRLVFFPRVCGYDPDWRVYDIPLQLSKEAAQNAGAFPSKPLSIDLFLNRVIFCPFSLFLFALFR